MSSNTEQMKSHSLGESLLLLISLFATIIVWFAVVGVPQPGDESTMTAVVRVIGGGTLAFFVVVVIAYLIDAFKA